jgi:hypothetical protein
MSIQIKLTFYTNIFIIQPKTNVSIPCTVSASVIDAPDNETEHKITYEWRKFNGAMNGEIITTIEDVTDMSNTQNLSKGIYAVTAVYSSLCNNIWVSSNITVSLPIIVINDSLWEMTTDTSYDADISNPDKILKFGLTKYFRNFIDSTYPGLFNTSMSIFKWTVCDNVRGNDLKTMEIDGKNYDYDNDYPMILGMTDDTTKTSYRVTFNFKYTLDQDSKFEFIDKKISKKAYIPNSLNLFEFYHRGSIINNTNYRNFNYSDNDSNPTLNVSECDSNRKKVTTLIANYYKDNSHSQQSIGSGEVTIRLDHLSPDVSITDIAIEWENVDNRTLYPINTVSLINGMTANIPPGMWNVKTTVYSLSGEIYQERLIEIMIKNIDHLFEFDLNKVNNNECNSVQSDTVVTVNALDTNPSITIGIVSDYMSNSALFDYHWYIGSQLLLSNEMTYIANNINIPDRKFRQYFNNIIFPQQYIVNVIQKNIDVSETRVVSIRRGKLFDLIPKFLFKYKIDTQYVNNYKVVDVTKICYDGKTSSIIDLKLSVIYEDPNNYEYAMVEDSDDFSIHTSSITEPLPEFTQGEYSLIVRNKNSPTICESVNLNVNYPDISLFNISVPDKYQNSYTIITDTSVGYTVQSPITIHKNYFDGNTDIPLLINFFGCCANNSSIVLTMYRYLDSDQWVEMPINKEDYQSNVSKNESTIIPSRQYLMNIPLSDILLNDSNYKLFISYKLCDEIVSQQRFIQITAETEIFNIKFKFSDYYEYMDQSTITIDNKIINVDVIRLHSPYKSITVSAELINRTFSSTRGTVTYIWKQIKDSNPPLQLQYFSLTENTWDVSNSVNKVPPGLYQLQVVRYNNSDSNDGLISQTKYFEIKPSKKFKLALQFDQNTNLSSQHYEQSSRDIGTNSLDLLTENKYPIVLDCNVNVFTLVVNDNDTINNNNTTIVITNATLNVIKTINVVFDDSKQMIILDNAPGIYSVEFFDSDNNNIGQYTFTVVRGSLLAILEPSIQYVTDHEDLSGHLDVSWYNNLDLIMWYPSINPIYEFKWYKNDQLILPSEQNVNNGWTELSSVDNLGIGRYTVDVRVLGTDPVSHLQHIRCTKTLEALICQPSPLQIKLHPIKIDLDRHGDTDGEISVWTIGGSAPYTYELFKENVLIMTSQDDTFTGLDAGDYTIKVIDMNMLHLTINFTVTQPTPLTVVLSTVYKGCGMNVSSKISAIVRGGVPYITNCDPDNSNEKYNYVWTNKSCPLNIIGKSDHIIVQNSGTYEVTISDSKCSSVKAQQTIGRYPLKIRVRTIYHTMCTFTIKIFIPCGIAPFTYIINGQRVDNYESCIFRKNKQNTLFVTDSQGNYGETTF